MVKFINHLSRKLRIAHTSTNLAYATLLVLLTYWAFARAPGPGISLLLWAVACLPLLILWPGMRRKHHRSYSWLCFVILLYFIKAVEGALSSAASGLDFALLVLSVAIFVGAMLTSRWLQYARVQSTAETDSPTDKESP